MVRPLPLLTAVAAVGCLLAPAGALASDDDVRVSGSCGAGATSSMRLKDEGNRIELRFEARSGRSVARWRVAVVQERRVVWRGSPRARNGRIRVRRELIDLSGVDRVRVIASGPRGLRCVAEAALAG
jgi:hypothetical protein